MNAFLEPLRQRFSLATQIEIADWRLELYRPSNPDDLISDLEFDRDGRLPSGRRYGRARAITLAQRIATIAKEQASGRQLLELGCGLGLVSLAAIRTASK